MVLDVNFKVSAIYYILVIKMKWHQARLPLFSLICIELIIIGDRIYNIV